MTKIPSAVNHALLDLFLCVASNDQSNVNATNFEFDLQEGTIIAPGALASKKDIDSWISKNRLNGAQLNAAFYDTWTKAATVTDEQRLRDQLTHYFTTYGLESVGLYDSQFVYMPELNADVPDGVRFVIVRAISNDEAVDRCVNLLGSGIALKQETIDNIFTVLDFVDYKFADVDFIKNNEARAIVAQKTGVFPSDSRDMFRTFVYGATGKTLVICNKQSIEEIVSSAYQLPELTSSQLRVLAGDYNRYKKLWIAFKRANTFNRKVVNKIARLSKKYHKKAPVDVLNTLTSTIYPTEAVRPIVAKAKTTRLIRSFNALRYHDNVQSESRFFAIRNGKGFVRHGKATNKPSVQTNRIIVGSELADRFKNVSVYVPANIDYPVPTSEKAFVGNIPNGTKITVPDSDKYIVVGIHWENASSHERVDLDLSARAFDGTRYGWDSYWRNMDDESASLIYSGDVTDAPIGVGAAEWFKLSNKFDGPVMLTVNSFHGSENHPFKVIVGYVNKNQKMHNYIIDPKNVLFEASVKMVQRQTIIGFIDRRDDDVVQFTLYNSGMSSARVARGEYVDDVMRDVYNRLQNNVTVRQLCDVVDDQSKADHNLSLETLAKDDLVKLFI